MDETRLKEIQVDVIEAMISMQGKLPGSIRYIWAGYVYTRDGCTRSFRCSNRNLYQCPGRAVIKIGEVKETKAHSHPREPHILQIEQIKQDMITRARSDKFVNLRTIYLEACKIEPLVRSHLGLDEMLSKMKKARHGKVSSSKRSVKLMKKNSDLNLKWTKDLLELCSGQENTAFCKICHKKIVSPTEICLLNHFLSKIHKQASLRVYRPCNKRLGQQNSSVRDSKCLKNENQDSGQENSYNIEVLNQFSDQVNQMKATDRLTKQKSNINSSFYKGVSELQTNPSQITEEKNYLRISNGHGSQSTQSQAPTISVLVWDLNTSHPISGLEVSFYELKNDAWSVVSEMLTNDL